MPKFVIDREIPGAGKLTPAELQGIAERSNAVLRELGPDIQWIHSYVTTDRIYCVYIAPDESFIREHAIRGNFPVNRIERINDIIDPATAESEVGATPPA